MTVRIERKSRERGLIGRVEQISGVDLSLCYQCKKCTSGCPVAAHADMPPSLILRHLHLGAGDELLESDLIWICASCETCYARCPMGIDIAAVMDALRTLALEKRAGKPEGDIPLFNRAFLETVRLFGRTYDLAMIAVYKLGSLKLFQDTEKFPEMLKKGKIALLPPRGSDRKTVRRIFGRALKKKS